MSRPLRSSPGAALLSLSSTSGAADLARALRANSVPIYATTGTRAYLAGNGIDACDVEELTGFPALFGGRVKTLHPNVFGAILYDRDVPEHCEEAARHGIAPISVVVVTLYPPPEIDIGGVALLRAAAKNYAHVSVLCDPAQYPAFVASLALGGPDLDGRRALAVSALEHVAAYDTANAQRMGRGMAPELQLLLPLNSQLRYGENPHESGAFYATASGFVPEQLQGKDLSYNNLLDLDSTLRLLTRSPLTPKVGDDAVRAIVVKHTIPCGVAQRATVAQAVREALDADRISAYGGILAVDTTLTREAAELLAGVFLEIVAAPAFEAQALELLRRKRNLRVMRFSPELPERLALERRLRSALGGMLVEEPNARAAQEELRVVSQRQPSQGELRDALFAWDIVRHVKSNGIVVARNGVTRGICAGQTNRVSAVEIATARAGAYAAGAACASDGFFPFADGLEAAAAAGCAAVIAPGGSIRDAEVIDAADRAGIALTFSSRRYFAH